MARSLVIVESPGKVKSIGKYLGRNYSVKASYGHVMDLPRKTIGILLPGEENGKRKKKKKKKAKAGKNGKAVAEKPEKKIPKIVITSENIFEPTYEVLPDKMKIIGQLRTAADAAENVYLATDPDRVDAQQARRVLDRIVGYKVSPLLWNKVRRGLSAGRVQTVALRLIVEREQEIRAFVPQEYWTIHAMLDSGEPPIFEARLTKKNGEDIEVKNQEAADAIVAAVNKAKWQVASVTQKEKRRNAPPPFTTSKLQQAAYNRLRYTAKRTMGLAQRLYEGVELGQEGSVALITYMRTDSVRVSNDALDQVRGLIGSKYGQTYLPEKPNFYKSKKDAQEGHEAVRPTDASRTPEDVRPFLSDDMFRLYQLIWQRFVASQMVPAVFDQTTVDVAAGDYTFRASGSVQKFDGYLAVYQVSADDDEDADGEASKGLLPAVTEGEVLRLETLRPEQHFTEPPPRYNDATLVKELEEKGIGRPSTYASIISTIVDREYVTKDQGRFSPTMLGEKVC